MPACTCFAATRIEEQHAFWRVANSDPRLGMQTPGQSSRTGRHVTVSSLDPSNLAPPWLIVFSAMQAQNHLGIGTTFALTRLVYGHDRMIRLLTIFLC